MIPDVPEDDAPHCRHPGPYLRFDLTVSHNEGAESTAWRLCVGCVLTFTRAMDAAWREARTSREYRSKLSRIARGRVGRSRFTGIEE